VFFAVNRTRGPMAGQGQLGSIILVLATNAVFGIANQMIDNFAHGGGLIAGVALAAWLTPRYETVMAPDGTQVGWRLVRSSTASWMIVPVVVATVVLAVLRLPGK
jgi:Rhomboid family